MTKEEFISQAVAQIKNKSLKLQTENELRDHIDERMQFYVDCGYDENTALEMTVEKMGDPKSVSESFSKVHISAGEIVFYIIFAFIFVIGLIIFLLFRFFEYDNKFNFTVEFAMLALLILSAVAANRFKQNRVIAVMSFIILSLFIVFKLIIIRNEIPFLLSLDSFNSCFESFIENDWSSVIAAVYGIITGDGESIAVLSQFTGGIKSFVISILSVLFYTVILYIAADNLNVSFKSFSGGSAKKGVNKRDKLFRCLICVSAFMAAVLAVFCINLNKYDIGGLNSYDYSYFYIAESDEPVDFETLDYSGFEMFEFNFDVFGGYDSLDCVTDENRNGSIDQRAESIKKDLPMKGAYYYSDEATVYFTPSKRYVAVIPADYTYEDNVEDKDEIRLYKYAEWQDTQSADELHFSIDDSKYPRLVYNIILKNK